VPQRRDPSVFSVTGGAHQVEFIRQHLTELLTKTACRLLHWVLTGSTVRSLKNQGILESEGPPPGRLDALSLSPPYVTALRETLRSLHEKTCYTDFVAEDQNITLRLPRDLLRRVKRLAADRDTSVSALMTEALARLADEDRRFSAARRRALAALQSATSLETRGRARWSREELHER
jgi:predicted transcriptional regulator